jgi:hypothetical protein
MLHTFVLGVPRPLVFQRAQIEKLLSGVEIEVHSGTSRTLTITTSLDEKQLKDRLQSVEGLYVETPVRVLELL